MDNIVRTATLELQLLNNKEVVKVAGVLSKLKNYLRQLGDQEYADAVDTLRSDSWIVQQIATELRKKIKELTEAIDDGDIASYDLILEEVRGLTFELSTELKKLNQDAQVSDPRIQDPSLPLQTPQPETVPTREESPVVIPEDMEKYTREEWDDPTKRAGIFEQVTKMIKIWHPNHDVPIGKNINKPFDSFNWLRNKPIHIKEGSGKNAKAALINKTVKLLVGPETNLTEEQVRAAFENQSNFDEFFSKLIDAIHKGTLIYYVPAMPDIRREVKERLIGEMSLLVKTANFVLPVFPVVVSMAVGLTDLSVNPEGDNKLVLGFVEYSRVSAGGVPPALKKGFKPKLETMQGELPQGELPQEVITPEPLPEIVPEVKPEPKKRVRKKSALRFELLKKLSSKIEKVAGVDPSAALKLSNDFWVKFVQMSNRLGAKPEDLAQVIYSESGFDPHATNVQDGRVIAKGLNQLVEKTAKALGMSDQEWKRYENFPAEEQLKYVEKFFKSVGRATGVDGKWSSATQLYVANFAPKYVRQASNPNAILYSKQQNEEAYDKNKGLDRDKKGHITAGDLARSVQSRKLPDFIKEAIAKVKGVQPDMAVVPMVSKPENDNVDNLLTALFALDVGPVEKMVRHAMERQYLPMSNVLVTISSLSSSYPIRMKFAKTSASLLKEMIDADTSIHTDGKKIELQCTAAGSQYAVASAVKGLCDCVMEATKLKYNGVVVKCAMLPSTISKYAEVK